MTYRLITPPAAMPVLLADAKLHLRIDDADLDAVVTAWIHAVTTHAEHQTGRAFIHQTWRVTADAFPTAIRVPRAPASAVASVKYIDVAGLEQTLNPADYELDAESEPGWIVPAPGKAWPSTYPKINAVKVDVVCGFGETAAAVPEAIKTYIYAKLVEQFDPEPKAAASSVQASFLDRALDPFVLAEFG